MKYSASDYDTKCFAIAANEPTHCGGFNIDWQGPVGFGTFTILFDENGKAHFLTECMCSNENKEFAKMLLQNIIENAAVED